jgi:tRNA A-37 threonylcarbamoyl transferase component Bud32
VFEKGYQQFYRYTSKEWYDGFQSYHPGPDLIEAIKSELPAAWEHGRKSNWYMVSAPDQTLIRQGWKIHISATPQNAVDLLKIIALLCVQHKVSFKFQADIRLLMMSSGKGWSRQASGKFVTIYPTDEEQFKALIEALYMRLQGFAGPYILTDLRYKDSSCVYYRYGGINGLSQLDITGDKKHYLEAPNGQLVPDLRTPYWNPPYWVTTPFDQQFDDEEMSEATLKEGRYLINYAISFSVTGGVYNALDLETGATVIIKEARPFTGMDDNGVDAVDRLRKEYKLLNTMACTGVTPLAIDLFDEWEHVFLVQELIEGIDLGIMCISENPLLRVYRDDASIARYSSRLGTVWHSLASAVQLLHDKGLVLGDLSIKNVLVDEPTATLRLIDFEAAISHEMDTHNRICTPGFASPQRMYSYSQCKEDDYYAIGSIMLSTLFPVSGMLDLEPKSARTLVESFGKELNIPPEMLQLITLCLSERPDERPSPLALIEGIQAFMPVA